MTRTNATFDGDLRARVPIWMTEEVEKLANERMLKSSDIVREALLEYIKQRKGQVPEPPVEEVAA